MLCTHCNSHRQEMVFSDPPKKDHANRTICNSCYRHLKMNGAPWPFQSQIEMSTEQCNAFVANCSRSCIGGKNWLANCTILPYCEMFTHFLHVGGQRKNMDKWAKLFKARDPKLRIDQQSATYLRMVCTHSAMPKEGNKGYGCLAKVIVRTGGGMMSIESLFKHNHGPKPKMHLKWH